MYNDLFKNKNFSFLTIGGFISSIGDYLYNVGITVFLYSITNSVFSIALMWLSRAALRIPVLYLSGIIADKHNRKIVILISNLISAIVAFLFIFISKRRVWLAYLLAFLLQSLSDIEVNSETAILPELVSKEQLSSSNSIFSFLQSTSIFISPAIGGILYKLYGAHILFIINSLSFLFAGILFGLINYSYSKKMLAKTKEGIIKSGLEGYKILSKYANVKTVFMIMSIFAILGRFYETFKVVVSDSLLNMKPVDIVYFDYALAIGGLSVPFIVKAFSKRKHLSIFTCSTIFIAIGYALFGFSHNFIFTFIVLIGLGAAQNIQGAYSNTIIQNNIPKDYIGRVFSFYKILLTIFAIIGLVAATPFSKLIGISYSFLAVSTDLIIACLYQLKCLFNTKATK